MIVNKLSEGGQSIKILSYFDNKIFSSSSIFFKTNAIDKIFKDKISNYNYLHYALLYVELKYTSVTNKKILSKCNDQDI